MVRLGISELNDRLALNDNVRVRVLTIKTVLKEESQNPQKFRLSSSRVFGKPIDHGVG